MLHHRRPREREQGQIIVLFALVLVVILAFTALVIDIGLLRNNRQTLANALDAGALAGGTLLPVDGTQAGATAAIDARIKQQINATYPGLSASNYVIKYRCLIGVDSAGQPYISRDIPAVCDPRHALGHYPPVAADFIGAGSTRSSICRPDLGDRCNLVEIDGSITDNFTFGRVVGVNQGSTGVVVSAACNGPCGQPPFAPLDVVVIIDRTGSMAGDEANLRGAARTVLTSYDPSIQHVALGMLGPSSLNSTCSGTPTGVHGLPLSWLPQPQVQPPNFQQDTSNANANAGATSLVINRPSGSANINGDFLVAGITIDGGSASVNAPAGWNLIRRTDNAGNLSVLSYYRWAGTSEPASYTWNFGSSVHAAGGIMRYTGVNTSTPVDVSSGNTGNGGTGSNLRASAVDPNVGDTALVTFHAIAAGTTIGTAGSGMNEQFDVRNGTNNGPTIEGSEDTQGGSGSTGNKDHDAGNAGQWAAQLIALRPTPVAPVVQEYGTDTTTDMDKWIVVGLTGTGAGAAINEAYSTNGVLNNNSHIAKAIACFDLSGTGTNLATPFDMARVYLQNHGRGNGVKQGIIFETDGDPNLNGTPDASNYTCAASRAAADRAKAANIEIFTIGFGVENLNCPDGGGSIVNHLGSIATGPVLGGGSNCNANGSENSDGDHFFCKPAGTDLSAVFQAAAVQLAGIRSHLVQVYPAPVVAGIGPSGGPPGGGTTVTISGQNFTGATSVTFGGQAATPFTVVNDTTITVRAPAGTSGRAVDVRVSTPGGTSPIVSGDKFTYN